MSRHVAPQQAKVTLCLDFLARSTPTATRGSPCARMEDTIPTSLGSVSPVRFSIVREPANGGKTPVQEMATLMKNAWSPAQSPFGAEQVANFELPFKSTQSLRTCVSTEAATSNRNSDDRDECKSAGERSVSSTSYVGPLSSFKASVKNTFIHVDEDGLSDSDDAASCQVQKAKSMPVTRKSTLLPMSSQSAPDLIAHEAGECKPCAFYWKPGSCRNGEECYHCHLCPEGEIRRRKKAKVDALKSAKREKAAAK